MKSIPVLAAALATAFAMPLAFASNCAIPTAPEILNGKSMSQDRMLAMQADVKDFIADGRQTLSCIKKEDAALPEGTPLGERQAVVDRYNAMVNKMKMTFNDFNRAVTDYKKTLQEKFG
ncbi:MAG: hypothetical protein ACI89D_001511 [Bermanella sp.]|jgi:hypothetical protein